MIMVGLDRWRKHLFSSPNFGGSQLGSLAFASRSCL